MYLNRITFKIQDNNLQEDRIIAFNTVAHFLEELLWHHIKKKIQCGGFVFLHHSIKSGTDNTKIKFIGQIIEINYYVTPSKIQNFFNQAKKEQIEFLLSIFKETIETIRKDYPLDYEDFLRAIELSQNSNLIFEEVLRVSKTFKTRKHKINIIRLVNPDNEIIVCRIIRNKSELLDEYVLENKSSVYVTSIKFNKSIWVGNNLIIYDRFGKVSHQIDITNYLNE